MSKLSELLQAIITKIKRVENAMPKIADDDEILEMLIQEDMLAAVSDADGSILTDENGDILLW